MSKLENIKSFAKSHSNEIMTGVGAAAVIGGSVWLAAGSIKTYKAYTSYKLNLSELNCMLESGDIDENQYKRLTRGETITLAKSAFLNLSAPVALILGGTGSMFASTLNLKTKYASACASYSALASTFKKYRGNVIEKYGAEVDQEMRFGIHKEKMDVTDPETGKTKKESMEVMPSGAVIDTEFAIVYDESCYEYSKTGSYNFTHLVNVEDEINKKLWRQKRLTVYEAWDMIGVNFDTIPADVLKRAKLAGWILDGMLPETEKQISIGITNVRREDVQELADGHRDTILLDIVPDYADVDEAFEQQRKAMRVRNCR